MAADDIARAMVVLADRAGEGPSPDLGGPQALTISNVNQLLGDALKVTVKGQSRMPVSMLRLAGRLIHPFNEVTGRQLLLGAPLDTQPQVVDSVPVWRNWESRLPPSVNSLITTHRR